MVVVFLVSFLSEYMFEDLRLLTKIILNVLAALVGAFLGVIISSEKNRKRLGKKSKYH